MKMATLILYIKMDRLKNKLKRANLLIRNN